MSDTSESLRRKIASAGDLQSVVRTMKTLAASNVGQYERSLRALADYYRTVELGLGACFRESERAIPEAGMTRASEMKTVCAIVFGSDQGLVGRFNEVVVDAATEAFGARTRSVEIWAVGQRVDSRLLEGGVAPSGVFAVPTSVNAIAPLVAQILLQTVASRGSIESTELHLFYNRPAHGASYAPFHKPLLPLDEAWRRRLVELPWPTKSLPEVLGDDGAKTLRALIDEYLFVSIFRACAESLASENASRLAAMQRAEKNIDGLLEDLGKTFHRLRQNKIDQELFDVVSGFEAGREKH